jgi:protein ImuA
MPSNKADIIAQLKKEILPLQGFKANLLSTAVDMGLGPIKFAFANAVFPLGAVHEFICADAEEKAATGGFIAAIISKIMQESGVTIWISTSRALFPPALKGFGIDPDKIIFVDLKREKDILWVMEEALRCEGLATVVGEMKELDFTASRRLQLAVEQSRVTGFVLRHHSRYLNTTACITRWKISSLASSLEHSLPGVGFPRWQVELLKVRNGKPGTWQMEWIGGRLRHIIEPGTITEIVQKKTG